MIGFADGLVLQVNSKHKRHVQIQTFILDGLYALFGIIQPSQQHNGYKNDGTPIEIIEKTCHGKPEKGNSIIPTLNDHLLLVVFSENLGQVSVEVTTTSGGSVDATSTLTPTGVQFYIPNAGDYIVTFTLPNGDEYYGEFTVTD